MSPFAPVKCTTASKAHIENDSPMLLGELWVSRLSHRLERHLTRRAAPAPLPGKEQSGVGIGDVLLRSDSELLRGAVNPAPRTLDFAEVADRRLVYDDMSGAVAPLCAKFLVAKCRPVAERMKNRVHLRSVGDLSLQLHPRLVSPHASLGLVRHQPLGTVFPQAQQLAARAQGVSRQIVEGIDLTGAAREQTKARNTQLAGERAHLLHPELDFDFLGRGHACKYKRSAAVRFILPPLRARDKAPLFTGFPHEATIMCTSRGSENLTSYETAEAVLLY